MVSFGMQTRRNGEGVKMSSNENKEEEEGDGDVIILCSTDVELVVPGMRQNENSSKIRLVHQTWETKRGMEYLVPLRSVPFHIPNGTSRNIKYLD
ncbi:hypothetical protein DVH24_038866 [Malus domestica]|uniref:Uncharacterized protein n=1 Tax=Malus domestica TaxID=3750 RepID=A0A498KG68_MALDO|nr:hypothetical protein DVH24_038866 [Malus domestica]